MNAINVRGVSASYNGAPVVDDVSLSVTRGQWFCLVGPNGSGKTTLLRAVAGLIGFSGTIEILDSSHESLTKRDLAKRVAVVPQVPVIPPGMLVIDYVLMGRTPYLSFLGAETNEDLEIVGDVLDRMDLSDLAYRPLDKLSGGELQRAVLARALAQAAPILLLDEPTTGLDVGRQMQVLELIDEIRSHRPLTILSAMHDLTLAAQFADELMLVRGGRSIALGPPSTVLTEEIIGRQYGAKVRIVEEPEGTIAVIPVRPNRTNPRAATKP